MKGSLAVPTELFGIGLSGSQTTRHPSTPLVLFIAGNPGSAAYFKRQIELVHDAMRGQFDVLAISHAGHGHATGHDAPLPLFSLQDQIEHKISFIKQHIPPNQPLIVIGHSIGAYISIHCVEELEGQGHPRILKVIAVFPFFWMEDNPPWKVQGLALAASLYGTMGNIAGLLSLAPQSVKTAVIRAFTRRDQLDLSAVSITASLLSSQSVKQNFFMGHTEFQTTGLKKKPPPLDLLRSLGQRLSIYGCPLDDWLSEASFTFLKSELPDSRHVFIQDARHAFVTHEGQNAVVAGHICEDLKLFLEQKSKL